MSKFVAKGLQKEVFDQNFGSWIAYPTNFFLLLVDKKLTPLEFTIFNYIYSRSYQKNKYSLNFSKRHLEKYLNISDRTAWKALKTFKTLNLVIRHYSTDLYGEVYTLNTKALKAILEGISVKQSVQRGTFAKFTPSQCDAFAKITPQQQNALAKITKINEKKSASGVETTANVEKITPNSISLKELYSIYNLAQHNHVESQFYSDCNRLIADGFTVGMIKVFLSSDKNDLSKVKNFYAVMKAKKEELGRLEYSAIAESNRIQAERNEYAKLYQSAIDQNSGQIQSQSIKTTKAKSVKEASFKINL